jgi:hypothetical protein
LLKGRFSAFDFPWRPTADGGFPGSFTGSVAAAVRDSGRLDVFTGQGPYRYANGPSDPTDPGYCQVHHAWFDNGWSRWHTVRPDTSTTYPSVAAVALGSTRMAMFSRGPDDRLRWQKNGF